MYYNASFIEIFPLIEADIAQALTVTYHIPLNLALNN
jgi:hypothetical protein